MYEGTFIKTKDNIIFEVKGLVHPPNKVVAFPRFISDPKGNRTHRGHTYRKIYSIHERFEFLRKNNPNYIIHDPVFDEELCEVPLKDVERVYNPVNRLKRLRKSQNLDSLEIAAFQCLKFLKEKAGVPWSKLGISGSLLVGLHTATSDIDPVVYGVENCWKAHSALRKLLEEGGTPFQPYSLADLRKLFDFRSKDTLMSFEDFVAVESRKVFQGKFLDWDYFIRFVKSPDEIGEKYGEVCYKNCGYAKIEASVVDDSEAIFTPCPYKIENVKII